MKRILPFCLAVLVYVTGCTMQEKEQVQSTPRQVLLTTTYGEIRLELSDKTPLHRDNFVKLATEGAFDSLLFHRVIEGFVIQGGDPDSKYAKPGDTLGSGDRDYKVPAEIDATLFHKRGALGAARDGNPERASSAMQFYIVQASRPVTDSLFDVHQNRINGWLKAHYYLQAPENKSWLDSLNQATANEAWETASKIRDTLKVLSEGFTNFDAYIIPGPHKKVYRTIGGTPHLDQNYTVFGEVIDGMEVVDSIATQPRNALDRPLADIRILSAKVLE